MQVKEKNVAGASSSELALSQQSLLAREWSQEMRSNLRVLRAKGIKWGRTFYLGATRMRVQAKGRLRLYRYQLRSEIHQLRDQRQGRGMWKKVLPTSLLMLSVACSVVGGEGPDSNLGVAPALSKKTATKKRQIDTPWAYVLPLDHGVRADKSGNGHFRASRFHGEHNGIDMLAPVGTPLLSACDGEIMSGASQSFGRWAHVICPLPKEISPEDGPQPWASFFFAHLDSTETPVFQWTKVRAGQQIGAVGKSGNAKGESIAPHVHLELIIQRNRRAAMDERHLGSDQSDVDAAEVFMSKLEEKCMEPFGFQPKSKLLRRARRVDPFVALSCLSDVKPSYEKAPSPMDFASKAWSKFYVATDFNVNRGFADQASAKD